uniref:sterol desaturase family protein n=1 Tax=Flavobacterium sp. TaxID=239 RepID=UPI00404B56BF
MDLIVDYFSGIPSSHRGLILAGGIAFFWLIEEAKPLFKMQYKKTHHALINIFFTLTTILVNFGLAFILLKTADFVTENHFGIIQWLPDLNIWAKMIIGLLLLDFIGAYLAHWSEHRVSWLWRFHLIHHTDTWVDTTTANRHHPGESVIRFVFTTLGVLIVGSPMWLVFLYQSLSVIFSQFNHANFSISKKFDKILSYIIVSPNMHKVHHHYQLPYTDTNYGNIFSIWDRLLGTFSYMENSKIIYGIDTYQNEKEHNSLKKLLQIPFQEKRKPTNQQ